MAEVASNITVTNQELHDDGFTKAVQRVASVPSHVEARRSRERNKDPVKLCAWIVNRPKTWFCEYCFQVLLLERA